MDLHAWLKKAAPTILTVLGSVGTVGTAILAVKAAPEAQKCKEQAQARKGKKPLTLGEIVKAEAPAYLPAAAAGVGTIGCIVGANLLNQKQQASLASAYGMLNQAYHKYKDRVAMLFGEEGAHTVHRAIEQEQKDEAEDRPPWDETQTFYFEPYGQFFERTMEQVYRAEYDVNRNMMMLGSVTVNDFLDFLELDHVEKGDDLGWNLMDGEAFYGYAWIEFNHRYFVTDDGLTVCAIDMPFSPHPPQTQYSGDKPFLTF